MISVIIPIRDNESPSNAIRSIRLFHQKQADIEIIILNLMIQPYSCIGIRDVRVIHCGGIPYAISRIIAVKQAIGDTIVFLNPDAVCTASGWLNKFTEHSLSCAITHNYATNAVVGYGAGLSLETASMFNHAWITAKPQSLPSGIPCVRGPAIGVQKDIFLKIHEDITDELFDGYEDQFLSIRAWYLRFNPVVINLAVYTNKITTKVEHPFTHYIGLFSLLNRLGFAESYIRACANSTAIAKIAYKDFASATIKLPQCVVCDAIIHTNIQALNKQSKAIFVQSCGDIKLPSITERLRTFGNAIQLIAERLFTNPKHIVVAKHIREYRKQLCIVCPLFSENTCIACGCNVAAKISLATETCPLDPAIWLADDIPDTSITHKQAIHVKKKDRISVTRNTIKRVPACEWCRKQRLN